MRKIQDSCRKSVSAFCKQFLKFYMREIPVWENYIPVYRDDKYQYPHTKVHVRCTCCGRRRSVGRDYADNCRVQLQNVFNEHAKKCDQMKFSEKFWAIYQIGRWPRKFCGTNHVNGASVMDCRANCQAPNLDLAEKSEYLRMFLDLERFILVCSKVNVQRKF